MHRLFLDLLPGGAPVKKSVSQYQALLATVRPLDLAGKTRRRMAAGNWRTCTAWTPSSRR
jgi:transposase